MTLSTLALEVGSVPVDLEVGHQSSYRLRGEAGGADAQNWTRNRLYLSASLENEFSQFRFLAASRFFVGRQTEFDPRALSLTWNQDSFQLKAGFQEVAWGETFGFTILDLVNPRDYRDPLLNELAWVRLPVAAVSGLWFLGPVTLQAVVTPVPRTHRLARADEAFQPFFPAAAPVPILESPAFGGLGVGRDSEWGGRASVLLDSGLDLGLIFYHHWNRSPVLVLANDPAAGGLHLKPVLKKTNSVGASASQAFNEWVLRLDSVVHLREPQFTAGFVEAPLRNHWQAIVGADWSAPASGERSTEGVSSGGGDVELGDGGLLGAFSFNGLTLGAQYQVDGVVADRFQHWVSALARQKFFGERLEAEIFVFKGIRNPDLWLQPKLTWNLTSALSASLRADVVVASDGFTDGALGMLRAQDRVLSWVQYRF